MPATLYLVRHAPPDWSRTDWRYDIPPGPPLTPHGEAEAAKLGDFLSTVNVAHIYASPLERAARTAAIAATARQLSVEIVPDIAEWERGETEESVLMRCRSYVEDALDESETRGPIALVTHGGPIRLLLADFGLDRAELDFYRRAFDRDNPVPPAGVWCIGRSQRETMEKPELVFAPREFTRFVPPVVQV